MTRHVRLVDVQISALGWERPEEERESNLALFSAYEPLRLWLRDHVIKAPFSKLQVSLDHSGIYPNGHVAVVLGICEVFVPVDKDTVTRCAADHRWAIAAIQRALEQIAGVISWTSQELEGVLVAIAARELPLVHHFERLAQTDKRSGVRCVPWFSTRPGESRIGVRCSRKGSVDWDATILARPGPIWLEDTFPLARSAVRGTEFLLLDKNQHVLARMPIDPRAGRDERS